MKEKLKFNFLPKFDTHAPACDIYVNGQKVYSDKITNSDSLVFDFDPDDSKDHAIRIKRYGHTNNEPTQMLTLESIWLDDIDLSRLLYQAKFYPVYPEPWATEQKDQGIELPVFHESVTEWGWDGEWVLEYQAPFYTWLLNVL